MRLKRTHKVASTRLLLELSHEGGFKRILLICVNVLQVAVIPFERKQPVSIQRPKVLDRFEQMHMQVHIRRDLGLPVLLFDSNAKVLQQRMRLIKVVVGDRRSDQQTTRVNKTQPVCKEFYPDNALQDDGRVHEDPRLLIVGGHKRESAFDFPL